VTTTQSEKKEEREKNKKRPKKGKDPLRRQKVKKKFRIWSHFASTPRPSQKDLWAALWTTDASRFRLFSWTLTDLLPIHIGRSSNIELAQVTKKRVLQRVLRYYGGSTGPQCAKCNKKQVIEKVCCNYFAF
jgi:hypothetical protein